MAKRNRSSVLVETIVGIDLGVLGVEGVDLGVDLGVLGAEGASQANRCGSGIIEVLTVAIALVEAAMVMAAVMSEGQCR